MGSHDLTDRTLGIRFNDGIIQFGWSAQISQEDTGKSTTERVRWTQWTTQSQTCGWKPLIYRTHHDHQLNHISQRNHHGQHQCISHNRQLYTQTKHKTPTFTTHGYFNPNSSSRHTTITYRFLQLSDYPIDTIVDLDESYISFLSDKKRAFRFLLN